MFTGFREWLRLKQVMIEILSREKIFLGKADRSLNHEVDEQIFVIKNKASVRNINEIILSKFASYVFIKHRAKF